MKVLFAEALAQLFISGFLRFDILDGDAGALFNGGYCIKGAPGDLAEIFIEEREG